MLIDHDGDVTHRLVLHKNGRPGCWRHGLGVGWCYLNADGTAKGLSYVVRWEPAYPGPGFKPSGAKTYKALLAERFLNHT